MSTTITQNAYLEVYASAARTATPAVPRFYTPGAKGLHLVIDVTSITLTPSVVFTIRGYDEVSTKNWTILASAAVTATGTTVLKVYPGLTAAANLTANDVLPPVWEVLATHGDTDSITYSVAAQLIP